MAHTNEPTDNKTFVIALLVVVSFIILFTLVVFLKDMDTVKVVAAIWGSWVGAVIGYFFGARPVDALITKIDAITKLSEERLNDLEQEKNKLHEKSFEYERLRSELIQDNINAKTELAKAKTFIEQIKKKYLE